MLLERGTHVGPYKILEPLGAGGMGTVYRARDERLGRDVALKMISHDSIDSASSRRRFEMEARTLAGINHPNLIAIHDVGADAERPFLITELIDGESLRQIIKKARLTQKKALDIAVQIAAGLTAAHEAGIIHRDLKPENVMVTRDGAVKLIDFGLAKQTERTSSTVDDTATLVTEPGVVLGTVGYMSPEQASGSPVDFRSDQFAFGAILYELLTGEKAFQGNTALEVLTALIHADPPRLSSERLGAAGPVLSIIKRCLSKEPSGRYAATHDLYLDLDTARTAETAPVEPVHRRRRLPSAAIAAIITGCAGIAAAVLSTRSETQERSKFVPLATEAAVENEPRWAPDGRTLLFVRDVNGVLQIFTRSEGAMGAAQITRSSANCSSPFWSADGSRIYYMSAGDLWSVSAGGAAERIESQVRAPAASPDGKQLAFFRGVLNTYTLWLRPLPDGAPIRYSRGPFSGPIWVAFQSAFSPDSQRLAVLWSASGSPTQEPALWIVPFRNGDPFKVPLPQDIAVAGTTGLTWMPDNRSVLFATYLPDAFGTHIVAFDTETGQIRPLTDGLGNETHPHISSDGSRLVFASGDTDVDLMEFSVLDNRKPRSFIASSFAEDWPDWSPSGDSYAFSRSGISGRSKLYARGARDSWERPLLNRDSQEDQHSYIRPRHSPDGKRIAYERYGPDGHIVHVSFLAGSRPARIDRESDDQHRATWSPDGNWIAYTRQRNGVWEVARVPSDGSRSPVTLTKESVAAGGGSSLDWSSRGDTIVYSGPQGLRVIDVEGRTNRVLLKPAPAAFGFSRDAKVIYGIMRGEAGTWKAVAIDVASGTTTNVSVFEFPSLTTVSGFGLHPDGRTFLAGVRTPRYDIWMLEGIGQPRSWLRRLFDR